MSKPVGSVIYAVVCGMHGFLYGTLYAPCQALMFGLDFKGMITWIIAGLPFDIIHGANNLILGLLIVPIITVLSRADNITRN
jgi:energy-coupling factor transport system substrate-specific component